METKGTDSKIRQGSGAILFRPGVSKLFSTPWVLMGILFVVHAAVRFGGLWNPILIPISLVMLWPLPWLLADPEGRIAMGFQKAYSLHWYLTAPLIVLVLLGLLTAVAWFLFGNSDSNWLVQHANYLEESLSPLPNNTDMVTRFAVATLPAMLFSPLGEEFFYRGIMLSGLTKRWGLATAMVLQAAAFALVHLSHYGLKPFQPQLILLFITSMFVVALLFGWIRYRSGSVWVAVVSHAIFNLGMNGIAFGLH